MTNEEKNMLNTSIKNVNEEDFEDGWELGKKAKEKLRQYEYVE